MSNAFSITRRLFQIIAVLLRFYVLPVLRSPAARISPERRLREILQALGGAWIKAGQALALRFDLLPREYCSELLKLLNEAQTFPYETVRQIICQELGDYPENIFASFDPNPLAAASIGQVHRATTHDGDQVAVKIQRPNVQKQFEADFRILRMASYLIGLFDAFQASSIRSFSVEFERWIREELDFNNEARSGHRLWVRAQGDHVQRCAAIYFEFCSRRVLATELLQGVPLLELVSAIDRQDREFIRQLHAQGYAIDKIARNFFLCTCNQIFRDGVFHADPHPANIFVLPGNRIGFVDFGATGQLSAELQSILSRHIVALYRGDLHQAVNQLLRLLVPFPDSDLSQAREDLIVAFENYRSGLDSSNESARELTTELFIETMSITRRHRISMPQALALYYKTVLTIDAVLAQISPEYNSLSDLHNFFVRAVAQDNVELMRRIPERVLAIQYYADQLLVDAKTLAAPVRMIENSLSSIQTRSTLYGVWSVAFCIGAYLSQEDDTPIQQTMGIGRHWVVYSLLATAIVLLICMHRQLKNIPRHISDK